MGVSVFDTESAADAIAAPSGIGRVLAELRAACTPANLTVVALLGVGWIALIGWTGAGPEGWQARSCAGLAVRPAACQGVLTTKDLAGKDMSRIVPHGATASLMPSLAR